MTIPYDAGTVASLIADARDRYATGNLLAAAETALRASVVAIERGDHDGARAAALAWTGVPDPRTAATVEHLCGAALEHDDGSSPAATARLHGQLATALHHLERFADASLETATALDLAERAGDPLALVAALHARQLSIAGIGGASELVVLGERMRAAADQIADPDAELLARSCRLEGLLRGGATAAAGHEIDALDVLAARTSRPLVRWNALLARAGLEHAVGRFGAAEEHTRLARSAMPDSQRPHTEPLFIAQLLLVATDTAVAPPEVDHARGFVIGTHPIAVAMTGRFDLELGDLVRARAAFETIRPRVDDIALDRRGLPSLCAVVELAAAFGDLELATLIAERLAPFDGAMIVSALGAVGPVAHFLGLVDRVRGDVPAAVEHGRSATALAARGGFAPWEARARLALAESLATPGAARAGAARRTASREASSAWVMARQLGMRGLDARAAGLERRLLAGGRLSAREQQVAGLVASGASNREIAGRLVLSERTVESHVQHILDKLGLHARTQIAAWATEAGLPRPPGASPESP